MQALIKADFWILFFSLLLGSGSGLTVIDNLGQMSQSLGYEETHISVSMISIWNFLGRIGGGYFSEIIFKDYVYPRTIALGIAQVLMAIGHFNFAMAWPGTMYIGTLLVGGATIVDQIVNITPAEDYIYIPVTEQQLMVHEVTSRSSASTAELEYSSEANVSPNSRVYVSKAHDVMTNVIAKGSAMRQDAAAERKLNDTGSAVKTNRYVSAGTSWLNGAFSKVAKAGHVAGSRTREKFQLAVSNLTAKGPAVVA
uniref:Uncharacterized protein n=1 Tax=Zea mays TaxID=4577 RepID=A0A804M1N0_MAIZE